MVFVVVWVEQCQSHTVSKCPPVFSRCCLSQWNWKPQIFDWLHHNLTNKNNFSIFTLAAHAGEISTTTGTLSIYSTIMGWLLYQDRKWSNFSSSPCPSTTTITSTKTSQKDEWQNRPRINLHSYYNDSNAGLCKISVMNTCTHVGCLKHHRLGGLQFCRQQDSVQSEREVTDKLVSPATPRL